MPWTLDSAEQRAADAPRSFFIPPAGVRHRLKVGDVVKLIFRLERDDGEIAVERMWVEVVQTEPYVGLLQNTPQLAGVIQCGDRVTFAAEHICGYAYDPRQLGYDPDVECLVLTRVASAEGPPALLLLNQDGSWEAHANDETDEELADSNNVLRWTVGYLADRFPQTEQALRDGSSLHRDVPQPSRTSGGSGSAAAMSAATPERDHAVGLTRRQHAPRVPTASIVWRVGGLRGH